jgi:hypothetical protein
MVRKDTAKNLCHLHTGCSPEPGSHCGEGKEYEAGLGTFTHGSLGDHFSTSWEAAWIDIGGEG